MNICGGPTQSVELPDVGEGACCWGTVMNGPQACTCWKPIYDKRQRKPMPAEPQVRARACEDCAYRPDSPERNDGKNYACNDGELDVIVVDGDRFYCHQAIRHAVQLRHPEPKPDGTLIDAHPADYEPPINDRVPYKANGKPADICAGWAARRAAYLKSEHKRHLTEFERGNTMLILQIECAECDALIEKLAAAVATT